MTEYYGRSVGADGEPQLLREHLRNVAETAATFADAAGLPRELGEWAGWLHDLGKYSPEFQRHLAQQNRDHVVHSYQGAAWAWDARSLECAFAVAAHHGGLKKRTVLREDLDGLDATVGMPRPATIRDRGREFVAIAKADGVLAGEPPRSAPGRGEELAFELRTRMLLSCLADADRLDAEAWTSPEKQSVRDAPPLDPSRRLDHVLRFISDLAISRTGAANPDVLDARREVLAAALAAAPQAPGFFSLTVPTGGGKTLASLAFALAHAAAHGQRRVIFVVPFLTIIEQNADVIRRALGKENGELVLEHHSNVLPAGPDNDDSWSGTALRQRLLAENWDSPVIMTSAVQFFESLFSDHPTHLRKIHNIANSVIVFDEAQTFPPELLRPLTDMLRQLVEEYRCSAVICTATQPALSVGLRGRDDEALLRPGTVREIVPDPPRLFERLKRIEVRWPGDERLPLLAVAAEMLREPRALAILNTKLDARRLFEALRERDPHAVHLSTRMCPAHRRAVLTEIRRRLQHGEPCRVASTQLVEAGVDVDFPAVWRAMGPLDAIAQAAGRCNREGKLPAGGRVTVFRTEDDRMPGTTYRRGASIAQTLLAVGGGAIDIHRPEVFTDYFVRLYNSDNLDARKIVPLRRQLDFPEVARQFRLIDDTTTAVLVPYGEGARWRERVLSGEVITRGALRAMGPYMVSLYTTTELARALASGQVTHTADGLYVFVPEYDDDLGLVLRDDPLKD